MKHKTSIIALAVLLAALALPAWSDEVLPGASVESLLGLAKERNPELAGMRSELQAASERVAPAGALMDPKLRIEWMDVNKSGTPTIWPNDVGSTKYTWMQDLPWFGKRDLKKSIAQQEVQATQGKLNGTWSDLVAKIQIAHAQRYFLTHTQKLTQELLDLTSRLAAVAQVRYASGLSSQQEVIRAQVEQTAMQTELVALAGESHQADARLNALLLRPADAPLAAPEVLPKVPAQPDAPALQERMHQSNPQLFSEEARIKAAELFRELTLKNRYPDFTLAVSPTQMQSRISEWALMLEVNVPLQQGTRRSQEREAQAMLDAATSRRQAAVNQLDADLSESLAGLIAAQRTEQLTVSSLIPQAQLTFDSAMAAYENGKLDFATLLEAQRQLRQAKQAQLKAQLNAQMRWAEVEKMLGEKS